MGCELCPRRCGADRAADVRGVCGMPEQPVIARAALHFGEEPCLGGERGTGAVFFAGCPLRCAYCQNAPVSHGRYGRAVSPARLADILRELVTQGAATLNLVNPTHFAPAILRALERYTPPVPVVWNSSGYESAASLRQLEGAVQVYLPDYKYADAALADALSGAADYPGVAESAIAEMWRQTGAPLLDGDGVATRGVLVRHLILPGHTNASVAALERLRARFPGVWVSLMTQYTPMGDVPGYPALSRRLTRRECDKVTARFLALDFPGGYVQEYGSAGTAHIPAWDLSGL